MTNPMNTPKSSAEIQTETALEHFEVMISKQLVKVEDAIYMSNTVSKLLDKCKELRISRDNHGRKRTEAEQKLKELKLK